MLDSLHHAVVSHFGEFTCVQINRQKNTKIVRFRHVGTPPNNALAVPDVPGLRAFYRTFGNLTLYLDEQSGDAAFHIASPADWAELDGCFRPWLDGVDEAEADEYIPAWVADCLVVGEVPSSGNYLLVPVSGSESGKVFEFEHDGFEFLELGSSLADFVTRALDLNAQQLTAVASHLRFVTDSDRCQWWIQELRDNRGNVVRTKA